MLAVLLLGALSLAFILYMLFRRSEGGGRRGSGSARARGAASPAGAPAKPGRVEPGHCVLCGTRLKTGERLKSDILPGEGDRLMRIFGCPHCLGGRGLAPRSCPVCGGELGPEDYALARLFERPGRHHVHVLGCRRCRGPGREAFHGR